MGNSKSAILKTLLYSDLFDFPLSQDELYLLLFTSAKIPYSEFITSLVTTSDIITEKNNMFCLKGREKLFHLRMIRERESNRKIELARKIARHISTIPSILFIGISGSVAMKNADKSDDIDFFIIVKKDTLWVSRFFILLLLQLYGVRRKKYTTQVKNKFCVNMIIDERKMTFDKSRYDIYTSREIAQLLPLYDRANTYKKFLTRNRWYKHYLANYRNEKKPEKIYERTTIFTVVFALVVRFPLLKWFLREVQQRKIEATRTTEAVSDHFVAFYPQDSRYTILKNYKKRLLKYDLS